MKKKLTPKLVTHQELVDRALDSPLSILYSQSDIECVVREAIRNMRVDFLFLYPGEFYMLRGFRVFGKSCLS
jgi:hypothetical protein